MAFEKEKQIRKGELDAELPGYEVLTGWLERVPLTWLPGLFLRLTAICVARGVFQEGGIEKVLERGKLIGSDPNQSSLREVGRS